MFNKVETPEQAFEITGITPDLEKFKASGCYPADRVQSKFDEFVVELVIEATNKINGNYVPNWADGKWKYCPAHYIEVDETKPAGFGLAVTDYVNWGSNTDVGERLYVATSEQALYIAEQFKPLFESARLVYKKEDRKKQ